MFSRIVNLWKYRTLNKHWTITFQADLNILFSYFLPNKLYGEFIERSRISFWIYFIYDPIILFVVNLVSLKASVLFVEYVNIGYHFTSSWQTYMHIRNTLKPNMEMIEL